MEAFSTLLEILDLEEGERDEFVGSPGPGKGRLYGGLVAAQSVMAAGRTVERGQIHSLHAYFLRPGRYEEPIRFSVDRIRDGRSYTTRRVVARQGEEAIFNLSASFTSPETGGEVQDPMPAAPEPAEFVPWEQVRSRAAAPSGLLHTLATEVRVHPRELEHPTPHEPSEAGPRLVWIRVRGGTLPDPPLLHAACTAYASDRSLIGGAIFRLGARPFVDLAPVSLDHAMWFHSPPRLDDWVLYVSRVPAARSARALAFGHLYARDGRLMCSVAQEGLLRPPRRPR